MKKSRFTESQIVSYRKLITPMNKVNQMRIRSFEDKVSSSKAVGTLLKYMTLSLMCEHHKNIHGKLHNEHEIRKLYSFDKVPDNCKCAITPVAVDRTGAPIISRVVDKVLAQRKKFGLPSLE